MLVDAAGVERCIDPMASSLLCLLAASANVSGGLRKSLMLLRGSRPPGKSEKMLGIWALLSKTRRLLINLELARETVN